MRDMASDNSHKHNSLGRIYEEIPKVKQNPGAPVVKFLTELEYPLAWCRDDLPDGANPVELYVDYVNCHRNMGSCLSLSA